MTGRPIVDIGHLVLAGMATSGVLLSTLRQAAGLDYQLTVLADGCLDAGPEVHRVLLDKVFPRQAEVTSIADWTASPRWRPGITGRRPWLARTGHAGTGPAPGRRNGPGGTE